MCFQDLMPRLVGQKVYNIPRIRHKGSKYVAKKGDAIINWGDSAMPKELVNSGATIFNKPDLIGNASNKRTFLDLMKKAGLDDIIPEFFLRS